MLRVRVDGRELMVQRTERRTIGRDPAADIHLADPRVSRHHAAIRADDQGWLLEDLGSRNGTFLDGNRVTSIRIAATTTLRLGNAESGAPLELIPDEEGAGVASVPPDHGKASNGFPRGDASEIAARSLGERSGIYRADRAVVRIGRAAENEIVVDDLRVSRRQAELRRQPDGSYLLVDLDSRNGTFVNGRRITQSVLTATDYVTVGHHLFRLVAGALEAYVDTGQGTFDAVDISVSAASGQLLVEDVSFSLDKSGFMAIVGPSGAGKSTLLKALSGFRPAQSGSVFYAGRDLYASYDDLRQRIGYVPQDDILHPQLTVRRALTYAGELRFAEDVAANEREQRVDEVMAELGLAERAKLPIAKLSGGQRKRASIGLELLTKPSLLFLDEPTSGLDPGYEKTLMRLLRDLSNGGRTVVVVTHSLQSLDLCDRVLVLAPGGRVAYFGPPRDALTYFGETDYADVFARLTGDRTTDWRSRFHQHPLHEEFVERPLAARERVRQRLPPVPIPPQAGLGWRRQTSTLTRRYLAAIVSDRRNLALLLLQAPILGALILAIAISTPDSFDPTLNVSPGDAREHAGTVALLIVLSVTLMGAANAIREIVKELPIYRRERAVGLSISAYVASKFAVLAGLTVVQAIVLTVIAIQGQGGPREAAALGSARGELIVGVALAGVAAMALALLVSAVVNESDKALTLLPLLLIPQIMLSGAIISFQDVPVMRELSYLVSAHWGIAAVASTVDMNGLNPHLERGNALWNHWEHSAGVWWSNALILIVLTVLPVVVTGRMLRRRDPAMVGGKQPGKRAT